MPTVPPTYFSFDVDEHSVIGVVNVVSDIGHTSGSPTPDPDLDDGMLVPVVTGDGVGAITSSSSLSHHKDDARTEVRMPRMSLSGLSLHSPSSIIGTPFDTSPRFEYPFPPSSSGSVHDLTPPDFRTIGGGYSSFPAALPGPSFFVRPDTRGHSPTHPKHVARDAPVPPSLAKKRWSVGTSISSKHFRKRARSASLTPPEDSLTAFTSRTKLGPRAERIRSTFVDELIDSDGERDPDRPHSVCGYSRCDNTMVASGSSQTDTDETLDQSSGGEETASPSTKAAKSSQQIVPAG